MPTPPPPVAIPPGWYPDPWGIAGWRWWDGVHWTAYAGGPVPYPLPAPDPPYPHGDRAATATSWPAVVLGLVGAIVLSFLGAAAAEALGWAEVVGALVGVWAALGTAVALAARRHGLAVHTLLAAPRTVRGWAALIGVGFGWGIVIRIASAIAGAPFVNWVEDEARTRAPIEGTEVHGTLAVTLAVLALCVGAPLLEELFFRGVLMPTLARHLPLRATVVVQAIVFAVLHLTTDFGPAAALLTVAVIGVAGTGLGLLRVHTRSLVPPVVAHSTFNAIAAVLMFTSL
jgi:membrane protease YdiL (CAAX protease family)